MFNTRIDPTKVVFYTKIKQICAAEQDLEQVAATCADVCLATTDNFTPWIYAAVLEAGRAPRCRRSARRALRLLAHAKDHPFAGALSRYLRERKCFVPSAVAFQSTEPYKSWTKTRFYNHYRHQTIEALAQFIRSNPPANTTARLTICDVGPGSGQLLSDLVDRIFQALPNCLLRILLIEKSPAMLQETSRVLSQRYGLRVQCVPICRKIEEMSDEELLRYRGPDDLWFVNGAASLHHMPAETKARVFSSLARLTPFVAVSDFEANNDLTECDSPELVYSVANFYGTIIADILSCENLSEDKRWQCVCDIFLTEAITMLSQPRSARIDYHAPAGEWRAMAKSAGFDEISSTITAREGSTPLAFTSVFSRLATV